MLDCDDVGMNMSLCSNSALANGTVAPKHAIGKLTGAVMEEYAVSLNFSLPF